MHTVDNQFELGQEVYMITKRKERIENKCTCNVCFGIGHITYKGYEMNCPKCNGRKKVILDSKTVTIYSVEEKPYKIMSYRYSVSFSGGILRYKLKGNYDKRESVPEEEIFATKEEAVKACDDLNMFETYNGFGKQLLEQEASANG